MPASSGENPDLSRIEKGRFGQDGSGEDPGSRSSAWNRARFRGAFSGVDPGEIVFARGRARDRKA
jgi:hypothetical protein